jgi:hypothetical protein
MTKKTETIELDNTKLYTRAEYREWQEQQAEASEMRHKEEQAEEARKAAEKAKAEAPLTDDQYDHLAQAWDEKRKERSANREAEAKAREEAEAALTASMPDTLQVSEATPFSFLSKLQELIEKGYRIDLDSVLYFVNGCYTVTLNLLKKTKVKAQ